MGAPTPPRVVPELPCHAFPIADARTIPESGANTWFRLSYSARTNFIEMELKQCRALVEVKPSPIKAWPRWPPQLAHSTSVRMPSGVG